MKENEFKKLEVIDGETLMDAYLPPCKFVVETLLPPGLAVLGGASKIGKSWLALDLCVRVSKGEPLWGMPTKAGATLYLCLEDNHRRIQERLARITDEMPASCFFATAANRLEDGLCDQIRDFVSDHPDTVLVVVDVFQKVRGSETDISYARDYQDIQLLKALADELEIAVVLVHHTRKEPSSDPLDMLTGSTGIAGAADTSFVLKKDLRGDRIAKFIGTGRDIEYRELELRFDSENCTWQLDKDNLSEPEVKLPKALEKLVEYIWEHKSFSGTAQGLAEAIGAEMAPQHLKQKMNQFRYLLEEFGIKFRSTRSNGRRLLKILYDDSKPGAGVDGVDQCRSSGVSE